MAKKKNQPAQPEANPSFDQKLTNIAKRNGLDHHKGQESDSSDMQMNDSGKKLIIKKAKIDNDLTLDVEYHEQVILISGTKRKDIGGSIKREGDNAIHDDLRAAFKKLHPHLALISEMISMGFDSLEDYNDKLWEDYTVTGFSIGGSGDNEGVTLIGQKKLSTDKILNLTTPFEKWENSQYKFIGDLADAIESCKHEVEQYLNGKMAPPAQQELDLEVEEAEEA